MRGKGPSVKSGSGGGGPGVVLMGLKTWRGGEGKEGVLAKRTHTAQTWRNTLVGLVGYLPSVASEELECDLSSTNILS